MNDCICIEQTDMVRGFKDGKGRFRLLGRKKGKSGKEKSLEIQRSEFSPVDVATARGVDFALMKGRLRGSKKDALTNVELTFETQIQAGVPVELAKVERKIALNEVKREFGVSGIDG